MRTYTLYNSKLGTFRRLSEKQMKETKKFYGIDFPACDEYWQRFDENSLHNSRGDIFLWITDKPITLELKQREKAEYSMGNVVKITNDTEYGDGHFAIVIFDRRVFYTDAFEFVRCRETGEYFVKDGVWVYDRSTEKGGEKE